MEETLTRDPLLLRRLEESIRFVDEKIEAAENDKRPFVLALCGSFSSGKTSMVNALLEEKISLPTGNFPITKVITRIKWADRTGIRLENTARGISRELTLSEAQKAARTELSEQELGATYLCIEMDAPFLRRDIILVDTPGFDDDVDKKLDAVTIREIKQADLCLLMFNAAKFGTKDERAFLKEMNDMTNGWFMPVLNCMNLVNTEENENELMRRAALLFRDCGNEQLGYGRFFPVCTLPGYTDMNGLDAWLEKTIREQSVCLRHVMPLQHAQYEMKKIADDAADVQTRIWTLLASLKQQSDQETERKKRQARGDLEPIRQACTRMQAELQSAVIPAVCSQFSKLSAPDFPAETQRLLRSAVLPFSDLAQKKIGGDAIPSLRRRMEGELAVFAVPEPVRHVRKRGFLEALVSPLPYEVTYNNFAEAAAVAVKSKLLPKLNRALSDYAADVEKLEKKAARREIEAAADTGEIALWEEYLEQLSGQLLTLSDSRQKVLKLLRSYS